jgi:hypothetical protein
MPRKTKAEKAMDAAFDAAFKKHASNVQFDVFDLSKIHREAVEAVRLSFAEGASLETAFDTVMPPVVAKYRKELTRTGGPLRRPCSAVSEISFHLP